MMLMKMKILKNIAVKKVIMKNGIYGEQFSATLNDEYDSDDQL